MTSLRKYAAIAVFTLGSLGLLSGSAFAQSASGNFTLTHEVIWQNAVVPAGEYRFSIESRGPSALLTLRSLNGAREGFLILVNEVGSAKYAETSRLVMVSRAGRSFVRSLELPEYETVLHFAVPAAGTEKELALASGTPVPTHLR